MVAEAGSAVALAAFAGGGFAFSMHFSKYRFLFLNCFQMHCSAGKILIPQIFYLEYICQFNELSLHLDYNHGNLAGKNTVS